MPPVPEKIVTFINQHHILTLATSRDNSPYCATCFYVYLPGRNLFVFTSDRETKHAQDMERNYRVAGAVALETSIVGKIRGIQFTGDIRELKGEELKVCEKAYLKKFPVALLKQTLLWGLEPDFIKMTDNRLGFGKKMIWKSDTDSE